MPYTGFRGYRRSYILFLPGIRGWSKRLPNFRHSRLGSRSWIKFTRIRVAPWANIGESSSLGRDICPDHTENVTNIRGLVIVLFITHNLGSQFPSDDQNKQTRVNLLQRSHFQEGLVQLLFEYMDICEKPAKPNQKYFLQSRSRSLKP